MIRNYGLTELFSESSEPPFDQFPFEDFKKLFPEGVYLSPGAENRRAPAEEHLHPHARHPRCHHDHLADGRATLPADGVVIESATM